jgi:ubiquinone/menaquinone biosynthesis C-methylase UbiE
MKNYQITAWCHHWICEHVKEGDLCIDATAGNGNDTQLLCELVGEEGKVLAFDIQSQAVESTKKRLEAKGLLQRADVHLESHTRMDMYAKDESVSCIVFNFGYLPGGDHTLATQKDTSIAAVQTGLRLLKKGGIMSLCIYSGGDSGFEERDALLEKLRTLDGKQYLVIVSSYYNRPNNPPIPVLIVKLGGNE